MTREEVLAKAAEWEAAGNPANAAKLRAYAATLPASVPDVATVESKAAAWEAAGQPEKAAKLRAYAATLAPVAAPGQASGETTPDGRAIEVVDGKKMIRDGDGLRPLYREDMLQVAQPTTGNLSPTAPPQDTFGETAAAMTAGPMAAADSFAAGFYGNAASPSRDFLANDPLTSGLPGPVLTGLGKVGDAGGALLSGAGAAIGGALGLATELLPGQDSRDEAKLGNDLLGMSQFAVPELAGMSSIPARMASAAPKVAAPAVTQTARDVASAKALGIPVMRTDVSPPTSFVGKVTQKAGESIPIAGTSGPRAAQNAARIEAAKRFAREYGADAVAPAIDDVTAGLLQRRSAELTKYTTQKREVIDYLADKGEVPVPNAVAAIDAQIAKLQRQNMAGLDPVIAKLQEFKTGIQKQGLNEIEANRAVIGEAFSGLDMGAIRGAGEKALSAVYGPLKEDMGAFIKATGGNTAFNKWGAANARLSEMAGELANSALKRVLSKGEDSPETVRSILFSAKPSDVRLLYKNLDEDGRAAARTAVVQEALAKSGGIDDLSPEKFKTAMGKLGSQIGVFFKDKDFEAADGLVRALDLTKRAGVAGAAPLTGVQNMPAILTLLTSSMFGGGLAATSAALGTMGGIARLYESTGINGALRALSKAQTPQAQTSAMTALARAAEKTMPAAPIAAQEAANATGSPEYEALWGKYGK